MQADMFTLKSFVNMTRHKHLKLDQTKIDRAKKLLGARTEQEIIDRDLRVLGGGRLSVLGRGALASTGAGAGAVPSARDADGSPTLSANESPATAIS